MINAGLQADHTGGNACATRVLFLPPQRTFDRFFFGGQFEESLADVF